MSAPQFVSDLCLVLLIGICLWLFLLNLTGRR